MCCAMSLYIEYILYFIFEKKMRQKQNKKCLLTVWWENYPVEKSIHR